MSLETIIPLSIAIITGCTSNYILSYYHTKNQLINIPEPEKRKEHLEYLQKEWTEIPKENDAFAMVMRVHIFILGYLVARPGQLIAIRNYKHGKFDNLIEQ